MTKILKIRKLKQLLKFKFFGVLAVSLIAGTCLTIGLLNSNSSEAASYDYVNFQGKLTDASGFGIASATRTIRFSIFDDATLDPYVVSCTGHCKWTETQSVTTDARGIFSVQVGSSNPTGFKALFTTYSDIYLGVKVDTDAEMTPRHPVGSVPSALNSQSLLGNTWAVPGAIGTTTANSGAFTTLSASGVLTSTVSSGTAPFTISSNTMVSNLNADLLDGSHAAAFAPSSGSGNYVQLQASTPGTQQTGNVNVSGVGIFGTGVTAGNLTLSNPGVGGDSTITFVKTNDQAWVSVKEVASDTTDYGFYMADNPDGGDRFFWRMNDWQGKGGDWMPLLFEGMSAKITATNVDIYSNLNVYGPSYTANGVANTSLQTDLAITRTGTASLTPGVSGYTGAGATTYWVTIDGNGAPDTFKWGNGYSGNAPTAIGIAITGSAQTLSNGVTITFDSTTNAALNDTWQFRVIPGGHVLVGTGAVGSPSLSFTGDTNTGIYSGGADNMRLVTAGADRMTIDSAGNVGIGVINPTAKLEINIGDDATKGLIVKANSATQAGHLQEWQNSSGSVISQVDEKGVIRSGGTDFGGGILVSPSTLGYPTSVTGTATGGTGTTTYQYAVSALSASGGETEAVATSNITNGVTILSGSTYNRVTWTAVSNAAGYKIYRTISGGTPGSLGYIGTTTNTTFDDTGYGATKIDGTPWTSSFTPYNRVNTTSIVGGTGNIYVNYTPNYSVSNSAAGTSAITAIENAAIQYDGSANANTNDETMFDMSPGGSTKVAQKFTASQSGLHYYMGLLLKSTATLTNQKDYLTVQIYTDNAGTPSSTVVGAASTIYYGSLSTSYQEYSARPIATLTSGTAYWVVITQSADPVGGNIIAQRGSTGTALYAYYNGFTWTTENSKNLWFRVYYGTMYGVHATSQNNASFRGESLAGSAYWGITQSGNAASMQTNSGTAYYGSSIFGTGADFISKYSTGLRVRQYTTNTQITASSSDNVALLGRDIGILEGQDYTGAILRLEDKSNSTGNLIEAAKHTELIDDSNNRGFTSGISNWSGTNWNGDGYCFTVTPPTTLPTAGDTYTNNSVTYTYVSSTDSQILCFSGSSDPTASGTLTRATGSGDATITFSDNNQKMRHVTGSTTDATLTSSYTSPDTVSGLVYRVYFTVHGRTAGSVTAKVGTAVGTARSANGNYIQDITAAANAASIIFTPTTDFNGFIDDVRVQVEDRKLTMDTNGNLGVGTSSPTTGKLVVKGSGITSATSSLNITNSADSSLFYVRDDGQVMIGSTTGSTSPMARLFVEAPSVTATYESNIYLRSSETSGAIDTGGTIGFGFHSGVDNKMGSAIRGMKENGTSGNYAGYLSFLTRANGSYPAEAMRISSTGYIGIGTTSPLVRLETVGSFGLPGSSGTSQNGSFRVGGTGQNNIIDFGISGASPYPGWIQVTDKTNLGAYYPLALQPNGGNVGIGTISPGSKLQIDGTGLVAGGTAATLSLNEAGTRQWLLTAGGQESGKFSIRNGSNGTAALTVDSSNNVGIGTTSPGTYRLNVAGNQYISGYLTSPNILSGNTYAESSIITRAVNDPTGWVKIWDSGGGGVYTTNFRVTGAYNNQINNLEFRVTTSGYGQPHSIVMLPTTSYNTGTVLGIRTQNASSTQLEVWIKLEAVNATQPGSVTVYSTDTSLVDTLSITGTEPTWGTSSVLVDPKFDMANLPLQLTSPLVTPKLKASTAAGIYLVDDANNGLFVQDGGNIGIGTASPSAKLDVAGLGEFGTSSDLNIGSVADIGNGLYGGSASGFRSATSFTIASTSGTTPVATFLSTGKVGIGSITAPTAALHLPAGTTTANSAALKFTSGSQLTIAEAGAVEWDGSRLYITQTTGPTRKTVAYTDDTAAIGIGSTINSSTIGSVLYVGASNQLAQSNANFFYDYTNNRLGIGTSSPTSRLDIQGNTAMDLPTYSTEFLSGSGWTSAGWTGDWATGWAHTAGNTSILSQSTAAVSATRYQIAYTVTGRTAGSFTIGFGGVTSPGMSATGAWGPTTISTANLTITPTTDFDGTIAISIKSITSNSAPLIILKSSDGTARIEMRANTTAGNTFIGNGAGRYNTTGGSNTANGYYALYANTTGYLNTAYGYNALYSNTTGYSNTATGYSALSNNINGTYNTATGYYSLGNNTTGSLNAAVGGQSLGSNTSGSDNAALGTDSLSRNTTGSRNAAIGRHAGRYITGGVNPNQTSSDSLYLGYDTRALADGDTNEIVIGASATGVGSNSVVLGNDSITKTILKGNVGIGTVAPDSALQVSRASDPRIYITSANDNTSAGINMYEDYAANPGVYGFGMQYYGAGNYLTFYSYDYSSTPVDRMVIARSSGNVGIGNTAPIAKLQVTESAGVSSGSRTMTVSGQPTTTFTTSASTTINAGDYIVPGGTNPAISSVGAVVASSGSAGTAVSITHGLSIQANDVVVAVVHANAGGTTITDNNGATPFTSAYEANNADDSSHYRIWSRIAGGAEPASYNWTLGTAQTWSVSIRVFRNVDTSSIWEVAPSAATMFQDTTGTTATAPSMMIATPGAMGLAYFITDNAATTYSGVTNSYIDQLEATGASRESQTSYRKVISSVGASGETSATLNATNDWTAHQFALKPLWPQARVVATTVTGTSFTVTKAFTANIAAQTYTVYSSGAKFTNNAGSISNLFIQGSTGNVGIGTTDPDLAKLQVAGNIGPDADNIYDLGSTSKRWQDLYLGPSSLHLLSTAAETGTATNYSIGIHKIADSSQGHLTISQGGAEIFELSDGGSIWIPSLIQASQFWGAIVSGSEVANGTLTLKATTASSGNTLTNTGIQLKVGDSAATIAMTILNNGNVGIGVTSPLGRLHSYISNAAVTTSQYTGYFENLATNSTTDAINKYGMYITSTGTFTGGAGTATNNYGLYVNTPTGADNNYAAYLGGNVLVAGSILPTADDTYDLGSSSYRWRDLYLGPTSLHLTTTSGETGTAQDWKMTVRETADAARGSLKIMNGSTNSISVAPNGKVGIGTSSTLPNELLDVYNGSITNTSYDRPFTASKTGTQITATSGTFSATDVGKYFVWTDGTTARDVIGGYVDSTHVNVYASGTVGSQAAYMMFANIYTDWVSHRVGINTAAPSSALHVVGTNSLASINLSSQKLTSDGTFTAASPAGWTIAGSTWTVSGNASHATGNTVALSGTSTATNTGLMYQINFTTTVTTAGTGFTVSLGGSDSGNTITTAGAKTVYIKPGTATGTLAFTPGANGTFVGTIDDVTIYTFNLADPDMEIEASSGGENIAIRVGAGTNNIFIGSLSGRYNTGANNTSVGTYSLQNNTSGYQNAAFGYASLYDNTTGFNNSAMGQYALMDNLTGSSNMALGHSSLQHNISGSYNAAVGQGSLLNNTTGNNNSALGQSVLFSSTTASNNVGVGREALYTSVTGDDNVAVGYQSLYTSNGAIDNVAVGYKSLTNITTGSYNTAIGRSSGRYITDGATSNQNSSSSVYLGYDTRAMANTDTNEIVIGASAIGVGSNSVVLGNDSITKTLLKGNVGIGNIAPTSRLVVTGSNSVATLSASNIGGVYADGTFSATTGWTNLDGTIWSRTAPTANAANHPTGQTGALSGTSTATNTSTYYQITFVTTASTVGTGFTVSLGGTDSGVDAVTLATAGTHTVVINPAGGTGTLVFTPGAGGTFVGTIDTVTVNAITASTPDMAVFSSNNSTAPLEIRVGDGTNTNTSIFIGSASGVFNTTGFANTAFGNDTLQNNTVGNNNTAMGAGVLWANVSGLSNTGVGKWALMSNITGSYNVAMGQQALFSNVTGSDNTAVGVSALNSNKGSGSVALGSYAGYYETLSNKFFVDNQLRTNEATSRTSSMLYGVFNSTVTSQTLNMNGKFGVNSTNGVPTYALDVTGNQASTFVARIQNSNTAVGAKGLLVDLGVANASRTIATKFISFGGAGTILGGVIGGASVVAYSTNSADYAEYFRADQNNMPQPGELVELDSSGVQSVQRSSGDSTRTLAGVVSSAPGFIGNGPVCQESDNDCDANYAKYNALVSLVGQVPVKANTTHGPIAIGDPISASAIHGEGAKAIGASYIVGHALEPLIGSSGAIQVLIRPQYYNPPLSLTIDQIINPQSQPQTPDQISTLLDPVNNRIDSLTTSFKNLNTDVFVSTQSLGVSDVVTLKPDGVKEIMKSEVDDASVIGVVAETMTDNQYRVLYSGTTKAKVSISKGEIASGDKLTTSKDSPGFAVKASPEAKNVLGVALEPATQDGNISVLIRSNYLPLSSSVGALTLAQSQVLALFNLDVEGKLVIKSDVEIQGKLKITNDNSKGANVPIVAGDNFIQIQFATPRKDDSYAITVTPTWLTNTAITEKTAHGFKVEFGSVAPGNAKIDWLVID